MQLTLTVKLQPNPAQAQSLLATMERFNAACNTIAEAAFREHTASQVKLHHLMYREVRDTFDLSAPMAVRAIGKFVAVYKRDKSIQPIFRPHGAIVYDDRLLSWKGLERVSILTWDGRRSRFTRLSGVASTVGRSINCGSLSSTRRRWRAFPSSWSIRAIPRGRVLNAD